MSLFLLCKYTEIKKPPEGGINMKKINIIVLYKLSLLRHFQLHYPDFLKNQ